MRKRVIFILCIVFAAAAIIAVHRWSLDGFGGLVFGALYTEDTVYAPVYSDAAFRQVRRGMPESEVHALLGSPLDRWVITPRLDGPDTRERWSRSPGDTHHRCRVVLYRQGAVFERHSEFYID
jgi:hypothetical protein